MYSWVAFPLLRITLLFAVGIVVGVEFPPSVSKLSILLFLLGTLAVYLINWWKFHRSRFFSYNLVFAILGHFLILLAGYTSLLFQNDHLNAHHLSYANNISAYQILVKDQPDIKANTVRLEGQLINARDSTGWNPYIAKLYVYVKRDENAEELSYGDVLLINGRPDLTQKPKNPGEFNYKRYLSFQNIYHQDFVKASDYQVIDHNRGYALYDLALRSRAYLKSVLYRHIDSERERAIALALLLGTKDKLTPELNQAYASAGAMHVLAVSGLHVGIIYGIMLLFFKKSMKRKGTKWIFLLATLVGLWGYAMITGLSASVLRAVTMFSLMTFAKVAKRESNIYNTLSAAGLILLCFNPYMIMAVGFQLSFLAVFGIVYITPKIYELLSIDQWLLDKAWGITSVSIAAQIATAPLVLLYFHQLPTYFFISNLLVIPAASGILMTGIVLFGFAEVPYLNELVGLLLESIIYFTNEFVFLIERIPHNTIDDLFIGTDQSWLIIASIFFFFAWTHYKRLLPLVMLCFVISAFVAVHQYWDLENSEQKKIVFYSVGQHTAVDFIQSDQAYLYTDSVLLSDESKLRFHIKPNRLRSGVSTSVNNDSQIKVVRKEINGNELLVWNGVSILILKNAKHGLSDIKVDVLILTKNQPYRIEQLSGIEYDKLIVDGTNSDYRVAKWNEQIDGSVTLINLNEQGSYLMKM